MIDLILKGLIIGFCIAAPVGPIGVLCINRSLHYGWKHGLVVGLGAAVADGIYGCVAGFGLTFVASFLISGIIVGSMAWWVLLSTTVILFLHKRANPKVLSWINIFSGIIIAAFGVVALVSILKFR